MKTYKTNYSVSVEWCNNALILCNNITEIDPSISMFVVNVIANVARPVYLDITTLNLEIGNIKD